MSDHVPWELRRHDECHRAQDELRAKIAEQAEVIRKLREELAAVHTVAMLAKIPADSL